VLDEQRSVVDKEACELRSTLREVEKCRLEGRRDLHDVKRQLKGVEAERARLCHEREELQATLRRVEQQMDNVRTENQQLRLKV